MKPIPKSSPLHQRSYHCYRIGEIDANSVPLFVSANVIDQILDFSGSNLKTEIGGFLIGGVYNDGRDYVEIEEFIPAQNVTSGGGRLTFTRGTWADVHAQIARKFPDKTIVGWQHTHPGLGVFLSAYDLFIHEHFFREPWQSAMVVDPKQKEFAVFQWIESKICDNGFICVNP